MSKRSDISAGRLPATPARRPRGRGVSRRGPGRGAARRRRARAADLRARRHHEPPADLGSRLPAAGRRCSRPRRAPAGSRCSSSISAATARRGPRAGSPTRPALEGLMTGIACHGGLTQIGRVLDHAGAPPPGAASPRWSSSATRWRRTSIALCHAAGRLALRDTRAFMFHEGGDPAATARLPRDRPDDRRRLPAVRRARRRASSRALLAAVAAYAAGGRAALEAAGTGGGAAAARRPPAMTAPLWAALALLAVGAVGDLRRRLPPAAALAAVGARRGRRPRRPADVRAGGAGWRSSASASGAAARRGRRTPAGRLRGRERRPAR